MNSAGAEEQMHKLVELAGKFNAQLSEEPQQVRQRACALPLPCVVMCASL